MAPHPYAKPRLIRLSRALEYVLRQAPKEYGFGPDDEGWYSIDYLLDALHKEKTWRSIRRNDLEDMINKSAKLRYEIRGDRIRVMGDGERGRKEATPPPDILYHGTDPALARRIKVDGLVPPTNQYIPLATDAQGAIQVGRGSESGRTMVLKIAARRAFEHGVHFYEGNDRVWLAESVPPEYISLE